MKTLNEIYKILGHIIKFLIVCILIMIPFLMITYFLEPA